MSESQDTRPMRRKNPYREKRGNLRFLVWLMRLTLLFVAVTGCATASFVLYGRWSGAGQVGRVVLDGGHAGLNVVERIYLETYLSNRLEQLEQPAGTGAAPVDFVVSPGESADAIAANLQQAGLLDDTQLFLNYLRYYGLDARLDAGEFTLSPQLTIPQLAGTLTRAYGREIDLRFIEGWRIEEMANYLATVRPAQIDADAFLAIGQRRQSFDPRPYDFLASLPADVFLEGFLFPDTYRIPTDADAAYLIDLMLRNFGNRVTPEMRQAYGSRGLSLHQAVTLASIVEREAVVPAERPLIAGVFYNRLAQEMRLQADPTVQYALGFHAETGKWWKSPLSLEDLQFDSPYNSYLYAGLPPGPIANPSLSSLEAVTNPAETDYLFFVADCHAAVPGSHVFSRTFEEHLAHVNRCR